MISGANALLPAVTAIKLFNFNRDTSEDCGETLFCHCSITQLVFFEASSHNQNLHSILSNFDWLDLVKAPFLWRLR